MGNFALSINLVSRCNQNCFFCRADSLLDISNSPSTENVKRKLKEYYDTHNQPQLDSVIFVGGGEPTMRPDLPDLIAYSKQLGFSDIILETNGVRLSDKRYVELLARSGLTACNVSLHSHEESVSDRITGAPGTFRQTITGIKNLVEQGIQIRAILFVINSLNYKHIREFIDFLRKDFPQANVLSLGFVRPIADDPLSASYTPKLSDIELELYNSIEYGIKKGMKMRIMGGAEVPLCFLPGHEHLSSYLLWSANLPKETLAEEMHATDKMKPASCSLCKLSSICLGISINYLSLYGDTEFYPLFLDPAEIIRKALEENNRA